MFSDWIRNKVYWTLDFLQGRKVKSHLDNITDIMEHPEKVPEHQEKRLRELISLATTTTEYYKKYAGVTQLSQFPIINKSVIKEHFEQMKSSSCDPNKVYKISTSGSTGTPFTMWQDYNKHNRVLAEMMYFWGKAGYSIGMKYVFFRIWNEKNKKSKLSAFARNLVMHDILFLDDENLEQIRQMLKKDKKIKMLLGYASTFENIVNYLERCNDSSDMFHIQTIISGSEVLSEITRQKLKNMFGCNIVSYYSNQENGGLAQDCVEAKEFHLNNASYIFEVLKVDSNQPAEIGELGRIVITDLYNKAIPLIRYDTGDLAIMKKKAGCPWKTDVLENISGRQVDLIYTTDGTPLSPHTWSVYMWKYDKLNQYQFIQNGQKEYVMKINGGDMYSDNEITEYLKSIIGKDAFVKIERVHEIPVLASGKFKKTICHYKPEEL